MYINGYDHNTITVNGKQFNYKPYYVPLFGDKFVRQKWHERIYEPKDFENAKGLAINTSKTTDFACIDIDCKNLPDPVKLKINAYISKLKELYPDIYIEKTVNNGFHVIVNMRNNEIGKIVDKYKVNKKLIANEVELFTPFDRRLLVIAPSKVKDENGNMKQYEVINGDIDSILKIPTSVGSKRLITLSYKELAIIIEDIRNIVGTPIKKSTENKNKNKNKNETRQEHPPKLKKKLMYCTDTWKRTHYILNKY